MTLFVFRVGSIIALFFAACNETDKSINSSKEHLSYEDSLYEIYVSLPAPDYAILDLDTILSDSTKIMIYEFLREKQFLKMSFSLRDSIITNIYVFGKDSTLNKLVSKELIGHSPLYDFIDDYNYCDFGFLLDKNKLRIKQ